MVGAPGNWYPYEDVALDDRDFAEMGARLPGKLLTRAQWAGKTVTLFGMRAAVDDVSDQLSRYRLRNDLN